MALLSIRNRESGQSLAVSSGAVIPVLVLLVFAGLGVLALTSDEYRPSENWLVAVWSGLFGGVFALALGWIALSDSRNRMSAISVLYGDVVIGAIAVTASAATSGFLVATVFAVTGDYAALPAERRVLWVHFVIVVAVIAWLVFAARELGPVTAAACGAIALAVNVGVVAAQRTSAETRDIQLVQRSEVAIRDPLTGLFNRRGFDVRFAELLNNAGGLNVAVVQADIDNFKAVNDRYGHEYGDVVLSAVAQRLHAVVRDDECLARTGGDEFMVAAAIEHRFIPAFAERLRSAIDQPVDPVSITISVGVAVLPPMHRYTREHLQAVQRAADLAMYDAKRSGGNRIALR